jgi:lipoprotein-anchoring transpeptidase ErfK/SrfK
VRRPLLIVDREAFTLRVYGWSEATSRYRRRATYRVAIGAIGHATPGGPYVVQGKSREPDWKAPDWSVYAGQTFSFTDTRNPFDGGFISLGGHPSTDGDGVGFHGTKFDPQLGTRASHGCVRMDTADFLDLYDRVEAGDIVFVI